jgi:hypothetical protein
MPLQKSIVKGAIWEAIGAVSLVLWTGDLAFSALWIAYRVITFPAYERTFKCIRRLKYKKSDSLSLFRQPIMRISTAIENAAITVSQASGTPVGRVVDVLTKVVQVEKVRAQNSTGVFNESGNSNITPRPLYANYNPAGCTCHGCSDIRNCPVHNTVRPVNSDFKVNIPKK